MTNNIAQDYLTVCWKQLVRDDLTDHGKYRQTILVIGDKPEEAANFLRHQGYSHSTVLHVTASMKSLPSIKLPNESVAVIVAQHVPGITNAPGRHQFVNECKRLACGACTLMLDLHASGVQPDARGLKIQAELIEALDWTVLDNRRSKCLLRQ